MKTLVGLSLFVITVLARDYTGDVVIRVVPTTEKQLHILKDLQRKSVYDFWLAPQRIGAAVDIHLSSAEFSDLKYQFDKQQIAYTVQVSNLQKLIDDEKSPRSQFAEKDVLTQYVKYNDIVSWLETKAAKCGQRCALGDLGTSIDRQRIKVIKITADGTGTAKPALFIDGGIHAREWISPVFVNNMINKFIDDKDSDFDVTAILDKYDVHVVPVLNPDGYNFSHTDDRLWRKNRATTRRKNCMGVDLNRNFGYQFGVSGVSSNPCSEVFPGTEAFSEPESAALRDYLASLNDLQIYLTFHSYGQYLLFPWGYGKHLAPNHRDLEEVGNVGGDAIKAVGGGDYIIGNSAIALYPSAGASDDWAYHVGAQYSYTVELPPANDDGDGFILPENRIPGVIATVWPGVKAMIKRIMEKQQVTAFGGGEKATPIVHHSVFSGKAWWKEGMRQKLKKFGSIPTNVFG